MIASTHDWQAARDLLVSAVSTKVSPAGVIEVGDRSAPRWREAFGRLTYDPDAPPCATDTVFDLASLTKVIATASIAMRLVQRGALVLDAPLADVLSEWRGRDREAVTIRHLLDHSSGLPAQAKLWERLHGTEAALRDIAQCPLESPPGTRSVYSDPGFMLLGFALERIGGASLDAQFAAIAAGLPGPLLYRPPADLVPRIAPTEFDAWRGRLLRGEVHDENAAALGGVAGHAGLFGTAEAVGGAARLVLQTFDTETTLGSPPVLRAFVTKSRVPGSSRALAWDTMLPTSSCGTRMSPDAIGHTGFTGTSLWIDPLNGVYVVLLTNRVHPTRANEGIRTLRPLVHDAVMTAWLSRPGDPG